MFLRPVRFAILLGCAFAATAMIASAQDGKPAPGKGDAPPSVGKGDAPVVGAPGGSGLKGGGPAAHGGGYDANCGPSYTTVPVTEWVPQRYTTYRTEYRSVTKRVPYTAYRYERVPVKKTRTVTSYTRKPVWKTVYNTCYERVPCWTTKTVRVPCWTTQRCTVWKTRRVDRGHWETCQVSAPFQDFCNRLGHSLRRGGRLFGGHGCGHNSCGGCGDSCGGCNNSCCDDCAPCPATRCVKRWRSCYVCEKYPCTVCKRVCTYRCKTVKCCTYKCVAKKVACKVCSYVCVPCTRQETYCCYTCRKVAYTAYRCESHCVAHKCPVTCCRMVCRTTYRRVATCNPCCNPSNDCCNPCCESRCGHGGLNFNLFSGLFNRGHGHGGCNDCGGCHGGCH